MQTLNWLEKQIGTIHEAQEVINAFHWFLTVEQIGNNYTVRSGEDTLFSADNREALDAFLYGMALAYKGLPPHLYAKLFSMMASLPVEDDEDTPVAIELLEEE